MVSVSVIYCHFRSVKGVQVYPCICHFRSVGCTSVYVYMHMDVYKCIRVYAHGGHGSTIGIFPSTQQGAHRRANLSGQQDPRLQLSLPSQHTLVSQFLCECWRQSSGHHACAGSQLPSLSIYVCVLPTSVYVHHICTVPAEVKRGRQVPWN